MGKFRADHEREGGAYGDVIHRGEIFYACNRHGTSEGAESCPLDAPSGSGKPASYLVNWMSGTSVRRKACTAGEWYFRFLRRSPTFRFGK